MRAPGRAIDPAAYRLLVNMIVQNHYDVTPLTRLRIETNPVGNPTWTTNKVLASFPGRWTPAPFESHLSPATREFMALAETSFDAFSLPPAPVTCRSSSP